MEVELEKEVEEYLENNYCTTLCTCYEIGMCKRNVRVRCMSFNHKKKILISFAEPREKRIEAQIEKMKCPQNCKNGSVYNWSDNSICMDCEKVRTLHEDNWQEMCKGCKYWELN